MTAPCGRSACTTEPTHPRCARRCCRGVIARPIGSDTIALCPPLVITDAQVDQCAEALQEALTAVETRPPAIADG
ncbi:MAG: aminotransferase class III-fold pyridoxal phosphate-dependent enzyme [Actinobacteria bacterium]|nr:aminotransferase class III-fold pyridoxal phosphate-dependent enzyme [Actinomycetota bacterium]